MNPESNKFEQLMADIKGSLLRPDGTKIPEHWPIFQIDEDVVIKGYTFRVKYIGETSILFEPVGPQIIDGK